MQEETGFEEEPRASRGSSPPRQVPEALDEEAVRLLVTAEGTPWRGFDVPDFRRWNQTQVQDVDTNGRIVIDPAQAHRRMAVRPVVGPEFQHYGEPYHFHVTVRRSSTVSRSELVHFPSRGTPEGAEYYYRWSTWFPEKDSEGFIAFPVGPGIRGVWQVITQWHQASDSGSPPLLFSAKRFKDGSPYIGLELEGYASAVWTAPLLYDVWHNFVLFVRYSNSATNGQVRLWYGTGPGLPQRVPATWSVRTTATRAGKGPYLKHGLYRSASFYGTRASHIVHCGMVEGASLQSVLPPSRRVSDGES